MWYLYVLQSLKDKHLYIGISRDPNKRLKMHNAGMTRSTRSRRPFKLIYVEKCKNLNEARKKEKFYKSGYGREIIKTKIRPRSSVW